MCGATVATLAVSRREAGKALAPWIGDVVPIRKGCAMAKVVDGEDGKALPWLLASTDALP